MRRNKQWFCFISIMLFFVMAFSVLFAAPRHTDECLHTTCDYCAEIEQTESNLLLAMERHGECNDLFCEACSFIKAQKETVSEKKMAEHSCHEAVCPSCLGTLLIKRIKTLLCAVLIFATAITVLHIGKCAYARKESFYRAFTLISLKVKLTA